MIARSSTHSVIANYCDILCTCARNAQPRIAYNRYRRSMSQLNFKGNSSGNVVFSVCFVGANKIDCICSVMANNDYSDTSSWSRTGIHSDLVVVRKKEKKFFFKKT